MVVGLVPDNKYYYDIKDRYDLLTNTDFPNMIISSSLVYKQYVLTFVTSDSMHIMWKGKLYNVTDIILNE